VESENADQNIDEVDAALEKKIDEENGTIINYNSFVVNELINDI